MLSRRPFDDVHYLSSENSLMLAIALSCIVAVILIRTIRKDISKYKIFQEDTKEGQEAGWKSIHGDVFRPPQNMPMLVSVCVGTGLHVGVSFLLTLTLAVSTRWYSPSETEAIVPAFIFFHIFCSSVAGYVSTRLYAFTGGTKMTTNLILTATVLPGSFLTGYLILNVLLIHAGAETAVDFESILVLVALWVCAGIPLFCGGVLLGRKAGKLHAPTATNRNSTVIVSSCDKRYTKPIVTMLAGGFIYFGGLYLELIFVINSLWFPQPYQPYLVTGFLLVDSVVAIVICALTAIVLTYLQLNTKDHRWWWRSFGNCASVGGYVFVYSIIYLPKTLDLVGNLSIAVYLCCMGMLSLCVGLFCGSVGFCASFWFTLKIYAYVMVDSLSTDDCEDEKRGGTSHTRGPSWQWK